MPKRPALKIDTDALLAHAFRLHQRLYEKSDGRIGARVGGLSFLLLRTTGRKSGLVRTATLVFAKDGEDLVLVASNNGSDKPPQWLENLRVQPKVEVQIGPEHLRAVARVIERAEPDYERLLRLANANNGWRYFHYQQKTARPLPVVVVTPDSSSS